jgi:hypothetical protein
VAFGIDRSRRGQQPRMLSFAVSPAANLSLRWPLSTFVGGADSEPRPFAATFASAIRQDLVVLFLALSAPELVGREALIPILDLRFAAIQSIYFPIRAPSHYHYISRRVSLRYGSQLRALVSSVSRGQPEFCSESRTKKNMLRGCHSFWSQWPLTPLRDCHVLGVNR